MDCARGRYVDVLKRVLLEAGNPSFREISRLTYRPGSPVAVCHETVRKILEGRAARRFEKVESVVQVLASLSESADRDRVVSEVRHAWMSALRHECPQCAQDAVDRETPA